MKGNYPKDTKQPTASGQKEPAAQRPAPSAKPSSFPSRKDEKLQELLDKTDERSQLIPDAVVDYHMTKAGLPPAPQTNPQLGRLLAMATQKFIADIAADAYQHSRKREEAPNHPINIPGSVGGASAFPGNQQADADRSGRGGRGGRGSRDGRGGKNDNGSRRNSRGGSIERGGGGRGGRGGQGNQGGCGGGSRASQTRSEGETELTMEDLGMAAADHGVNVNRAPFYR